MSKHTPGPWKAEYNPTPTPYRGWHIKACDSAQTPVAVVCEPIGGKKVDGKSPFQTANARLIASAPRLMEALKRLAQHDIAQDMRENLPHCMELQEAVDAIAEAEETDADED